MTTATANLPVPVTGMSRLMNALRGMTQPSRLLFGVAGVAVVANAMALAAAPEPNAAAGGASSGRLGASLQDALGKRDRDAAAERRKLEMREQAVRAGETRLAGQLQGQQPGQPAQPGAPAPGRSGQDQPEVPYDTLAQIYQRMKPQRAAPIFEKLDLEVQTQVARRMRDQVTAQILSYMTPAAAVELSMSLAGRKVVHVRTPPPVAQTPPQTRPKPQAKLAGPAKVPGAPGQAPVAAH
ncbi:MgtE-like protein [Novosphingobium sp. PhB165]|uniref:MotE family protein n=1 Tax=Novosphingobium sp. PhB165 TaxID=2485105 RepID=UPI0010D4DEBC|nr:magnesium transporter [Novosphingobium sp. PhB165]TCM17698.1 MgtE-like protein [Novosphingobium sp. PhB165]